MERDFLEKLGLDKDAVGKIMAEHGKVKNALVAAEGERDGLKKQFDDVNAKLEAFKGVDVDGLKKEIDALKTDMQKKDADYQKQISERDFDAMVSEAIREASGKNVKAVKALLDTEALKDSKNQKADIEAAIKAAKESDSYLFGEGKQENNKVKISTAAEHTENNPGGDNNAAMNALIRGESKGD